MFSGAKFSHRVLMIGISLFLTTGVQSGYQAEAKAKCEATKHVLIKDHELKGQGCSEKDAKEDAKKNGAKLCTDDNDPKCTEESCYENDKCLPIGTDWSKEKWACDKVNKEGCTNGKGYECTWTGIFTCGCKCQKP